MKALLLCILLMPATLIAGNYAPMQAPTKEVLALTLLMEARGEGEEGMRAVACVIVNRFNKDANYNGLKAVILKHKQFSCWNGGIDDAKAARLLACPQATEAFLIADQVVRGIPIKNPVGQATFYHANTCKPSWANKFNLVAIIGNHLFYEG